MRLSESSFSSRLSEVSAGDGTFDANSRTFNVVDSPERSQPTSNGGRPDSAPKFNFPFVVVNDRMTQMLRNRKDFNSRQSQKATFDANSQTLFFNLSRTSKSEDDWPGISLLEGQDKASIHRFNLVPMVSQSELTKFREMLLAFIAKNSVFSPFDFGKSYI